MNPPRSLDFALALADLGLSIIPIPRPDASHAGKRPAIPWKQYQTTRADESQIREWFATEQNVGIVTGAVSGVVVVDTDSADAEAYAKAKLPLTPWRVQTSKGWHRYFRHPGTPVRNRSRILTADGRQALDVRGDGGFVVGPGSVHASGHVYTARGDWSVPARLLPAFWPGWLERPRPAPRPVLRPSLSHLDATARARAYLRALPRPVVGEGSDEKTFYAAARLLRGFNLDAATTLSLLCDWCPSDFDGEWIAEKIRSAERYATEPIGELLHA